MILFHFISANAAFIALQSADISLDGVTSEEMVSFAESQIHYALGDAGHSYVCGVGNNPPERPHHRGRYVCGVGSNLPERPHHRGRYMYVVGSNPSERPHSRVADPWF